MKRQVYHCPGWGILIDQDPDKVDDAGGWMKSSS
jgi:hypothetical protein